MDFEFTQEQKMLRQAIKDFLTRAWSKEKEREFDRKGEFPREMYLKMAELGFLGYPFPEKYGGGGGGIMDFTIIQEELARNSFMMSSIWGLPLLFGGEQLLHCGTEEQRKKFIPEIGRGELIFCFALTEPDIGSDAAAVKTTATKVGDDFVINGTKTFISGADIADYVVTVARTDPEVSKYKGLTLFLVDTKSVGFQARPIDKIGGKAIAACDVSYDDVKVNAENILGGPDGLNQGWAQMLTGLDTERICMAATGVGFAQQILNETVRYAKERIQFGQPIGKYQAISHPLADLATELEMTRTFLYYTAWLKSEGKPCSKESAMAKLQATELAKKAALHGMQTLGAYGYSMEFDMQRYLRDALLGVIGGGTSQIQRNIIAKSLGL